MSLTRGLILLVEDDPDLRDAIETLLHRANYDVISTGDGIRAVELADEFEPVAALVDLLVPGQSGFRVTLALKSRFGDDVRVAVMSANDSAAHQDYAAASGAIVIVLVWTRSFVAMFWGPHELDPPRFDVPTWISAVVFGPTVFPLTVMSCDSSTSMPMRWFPIAVLPDAVP